MTATPETRMPAHAPAGTYPRASSCSSGAIPPPPSPCRTENNEHRRFAPMRKERDLTVKMQRRTHVVRLLPAPPRQPAAARQYDSIRHQLMVTPGALRRRPSARRRQCVRKATLADRTQRDLHEVASEITTRLARGCDFRGRPAVGRAGSRGCAPTSLIDPSQSEHDRTYPGPNVGAFLKMILTVRGAPPLDGSGRWRSNGQRLKPHPLHIVLHRPACKDSPYRRRCGETGAADTHPIELSLLKFAVDPGPRAGHIISAMWARVGARLGKRACCGPTFSHRRQPGGSALGERKVGPRPDSAQRAPLKTSPPPPCEDLSNCKRNRLPWHSALARRTPLVLID